MSVSQLEGLHAIEKALEDLGLLPSQNDEVNFYHREMPILNLEFLQNPYVALAAVGSNRLGLVFFHDYDSVADFYEEDNDSFYREVIGKTNALLQKSQELVNIEGAVVLPISHIVINAPTSIHRDGNDFHFYALKVCTRDTIVDLLKHIKAKVVDFDELILQAASTLLSGFSVVRKKISPPRKKPRDSTKGYVIQKLYRAIARADLNQRRAAVDDWTGIQRIRGLAGSGKTAVLAVKALRLHMKNPDALIAITFYSRSLYDHYRKLLDDIATLMDFEPNWDKLKLLHAWGGRNRSGIYTLVANEVGATPHTWRSARRKYLLSAGDFESEFDLAVKELLDTISKTEKSKIPKLFDAILVDEAQDFSPSFFRLLFSLARTPIKIAYAYDEMQSLVGRILPEPEDLFQLSKQQAEELFSDENRDIWLRRVYRTNRKLLTFAHALGFGIYRDDAQVQAFDPPSTWEKVGYEVLKGELDFGKKVVLARATNSHYQGTENLFAGIEDTIIFKEFRSRRDELSWVLRDISSALNEGVPHKNILIIAFNPIELRNIYAEFNDILLSENSARVPFVIHQVGDQTPPDQVFVDDSVALLHIYRAKGLEVPLVYIVASEDGDTGRVEVDTDLIKRRNFLFTAITRAHGWVRVTGTGPIFSKLRKEHRALLQQEYKLNFVYPNKSEVRKLHTLRLEAASGWALPADYVEELLARLGYDYEKTIGILKQELGAARAKKLMKEVLRKMHTKGGVQ